MSEWTMHERERHVNVKAMKSKNTQIKIARIGVNKESRGWKAVRERFPNRMCYGTG